MQFSNFPLYSNIRKTDKELQPICQDEKDFVSEKIKTMKESEHEIVYALIRAFFLENENSVIGNDTLPYKGKKLKTGIKWEIDNLPWQLQRILYIFCKIELEQ